MKTEPTIVIRFEDDRRLFQPGETLAGHYSIVSVQAEDIKAVEASVLWHTEGKGDEDMAVHEFWGKDLGTDFGFDPTKAVHLETTLPNSPLSYDGQIVKLRWCVRVRVFLARGKDIMGEKTFQLGNVVSFKPSV